MAAIEHIVLIGTGNVARQLGGALQTQGININQVWSRNRDKASSLANELDAECISRTEDLSTTSDLYLLCVSDDSIPTVAEKLPKGLKGIICHCSGATGLDALHADKAGVFWPLQTITRDHSIQWNDVPICVEGSNEEVANTLAELGRRLSDKVEVLNGNQRELLHLAAVFAANYSNFMLVLAQKILEKGNIDKRMLEPLVLEVARKFGTADAWKNQTGPAKRGDLTVIESHRELLENEREIRDIYISLAQMIRDYDN